MNRRLLTLTLAVLTIGLLGSCSEINERIDGLDQRIGSIENEKIEKIQTVSIIPAYSDGSVEAVGGSLTIDCIISPKEAVGSLKRENFAVLINEVLTKGASVDTIRITRDEDLVIDKEEGTATIRVDVLSKLPSNGKALTVALNVKNGISDFTTKFVGVTVVKAPVRVADLVVYGKIFRSETDRDGEFLHARAFAVKDGKFIYVGDENGAAPFIEEGKTTVIDHREKGIIIPGCYEGHAHYMMANGMNLMGGPMLKQECTPDEFKAEIKKAYDQAKADGKSSIYGFGWSYQNFIVSMPTRQELDAICPDIALFVSDAEGHKGLANTKCLQNAGIMDKNGDVLIVKIRGGEICMDENGKPNGLLQEQASTYVRKHGINFNEIFPASLGVQAVEKSQEQLLANGYVSYMDGWSNYYGNDSFYEGAKSLEQAGKLNMLLGMSYEFESSTEDVEGEIEKAKSMKKYSGGHINADYVKIFIDGTVESGTGFTLQPYQYGEFGYGMVNWDEDEVKTITELANNNGMTMHVHAMGDAAVNRAVNAFVDGGKPELRNTVVHTRNVPQADFQRMADNNIVAVSGILWHGMSWYVEAMLNEVVPENLMSKAYPMKSYFKAGAIMTSHTDYPATSGSPTDPFGIMEIAVSGQMHTAEGLTDPFWTDELITREWALQALTINGAYQMHVEDERGSITVGKYADFLLVDKDVLECAQEDIHNAKVVSTWFEGKKVYPANL